MSDIISESSFCIGRANFVIRKEGKGERGLSVELEERYDCIYRYCYMKLQNRQAAEDVTQETFLAFLESGTYRDMGRELSYLYTIARNKCMDYYRKKECLPLSGEAEGKEEDMAQSLVVSQSLREALKELTEEEQELIFLRYINETPVGVMAKLTGQSRFAVRRRLKRILEKLGGLLGKEDAF